MAAISPVSDLHEIRFGTDGWRALIAKEFTYKNLELCLNGLCSYLIDEHEKGCEIYVGYDARFLADQFAAFAGEIFNQWGIKVKMIDHPVPTPVIAFACSQDVSKSAGSLTFTASHNPPEYMGIKYIPNYGGPASLKITNRILEEIDKHAADANYKDKIQDAHEIEALENAIESINPQEAYFAKLRETVDFKAIQDANAKAQKTIIYDGMHGCGNSYTNKLLEEAGFKVEALHSNYDPTFGGALPDPKEDRLGKVKECIKTLDADMGAANDGDADRFSFIDKEGNFYPANKSLSIIAKYLYEKRGFKGIIARTVATSHIFDEIAAKFGEQSIETAVGFKWLCEVMRDRPTVLCAEESGGMSVQGHIPEKDGILAVLLLSEVLAVTGKSLKELWKEVQDFVGKKYFYHRLDLHVKDEAEKQKFMQDFKDPSLKNIADFKVTKTDFTEGAKVYLEATDGKSCWILARPSGTEAMCRVYLETNEAETLENLKTAIKALV